MSRWARISVVWPTTSALLEGALGALKSNYDGYHFTWPSPDIYNPFSLLNALTDSKLNSYWFGSGTPTYLIEMLNKYHVKPQQIGARKVLAESFDAPTERMVDITPLLYQSGYITIKDYSSLTNLYTLDIPNKGGTYGIDEEFIAQLFASIHSGWTYYSSPSFRGDLWRADGRCPASVADLPVHHPQCDNTDYEGHYQSLLYTIFSLLGMYVDVEVRTPKGRVDMVMRTPTTLYVVELKLNKTMDIALEQINLRNYPERFAFVGCRS